MVIKKIVREYIGKALMEKLFEVYPNAPSLRQKVYDISMNDLSVSKETLYRAIEIAAIDNGSITS